SSLDSLSYLLY
ncbi:hypothetical protein RSAG8_08340, partial [Rhizoctonia solani AG-8 WAC10335]